MDGVVHRACGGGRRRAACPYCCRQGPQRLLGQGRPQAVAQRCGAPLRREERPRSLREACLEREGLLAVRVSGGVAASCWSVEVGTGCRVVW